MQLDPRSPDFLISNQAFLNVAKVKSHVQAFVRTEQDLELLTGTLNNLAVYHQARPIGKKISLQGRISRMVDPLWWRRNLRRELVRANEDIEHAAGAVRRKGQCYVSDFAMKRKAERAKANRATLQNLEVANETGQALNLLEVSDASVSNPKLRRAELMTRCRGFEETAAFMGHAAIFLTMTLPSRFHRFDGKGQSNKNWTAEKIKEGQKHLCEMWKKIRAAWGRAGFFPYGFRVAEPHHDGCPHWHILLFVDTEHVGWFEPSRLVAGRKDHGAGLVGIAGKYALKDSPHEAGAIKHRFTCKRIDASKGSATGYIAKYIAKNIDGLTEHGDGVGLDFASGKTAQDGSARVRTWASTHSIRQFQQIGGPSVTVWRELRRMGDTQSQNELFEKPRAAADRACWFSFWMLQGGPDVKRSKLTLKPEYIADGLGRYGDDVKRVWGVAGTDSQGRDYGLQTRLHTWTVQRSGLADINHHAAVRIDERAIEAGALAYVREAGFASVSDFQAHGAAVSPWTGVNNCTESSDDDDEKAALKLDFLRSRPIRSTEPSGTWQH